MNKPKPLPKVSVEFCGGEETGNKAACEALRRLIKYYCEGEDEKLVEWICEKCRKGIEM